MPQLPASNAVIPVGLGEMLYVSLAHILDYVNEHGGYPPGLDANMRKVLRRYERDRTAALLQRGFSATAILRYTQKAGEKLTEWMDNSSAKTEAAQADFHKWAEELAGGEDLS